MVEKRRLGLSPILGSVLAVSLGLLSAASCVAAECSRAKWKDLRLEGALCRLPGSGAFGLGIAALGFWCAAQIAGTLYVRGIWKRGPKKPLISTSLRLLSWTSFAIGVVLLGSATSMSRKQDYGKGWLDGECYIVKDGIFIASAILSLLSVTSTLALAAMSLTQVDRESMAYQ